MITPEDFYGGARAIDVSGNVDLRVGLGRFKIMNVLASGLKAVLPILLPPTHRRIRAGGPVFKLLNVGIEPILVVDQLDQPIGWVNVGRCCVVLLTRADDPIGNWALGCLPSVQAGTTQTTQTTLTTITTTTIDPCEGKPTFGQNPNRECTTASLMSSTWHGTATTHISSFTPGEWHFPNHDRLIGIAHTEEGI